MIMEKLPECTYPTGQHRFDQADGTCSRCGHKVKHDIQVWRETAVELGLTSILAPDGKELLIFRGDHKDLGLLLIRADELIGWHGLTDQSVYVNAAEALGMLGRMVRGN